MTDTTRLPARQPSKKVKRLKKKILLLRLEELVLLLIIAALVLTRCSSVGERNQIVQNFTEDQIQSEYAWLQEHSDQFPEGKVAAAEGNSGLIHFLYEYGNDDYQTTETASLSREETQAQIPLFLQWDERWGYDSYGDNNIGMCGCAPTCLAMVTEGLTRDTSITPKSVADYAMNNDQYLYGTGTKWTIFDAYAAECQLQCREVGQSTADIYWELQQGHPVICSMAPGTFTTGGHFIVLCGLENGEVVVNDPNNVELSMKQWNLNDITNEVKNAWAFSQS